MYRIDTKDTTKSKAIREGGTNKNVGFDPSFHNNEKIKDRGMHLVIRDSISQSCLLIFLNLVYSTLLGP